MLTMLRVNNSNTSIYYDRRIEAKTIDILLLNTRPAGSMSGFDLHFNQKSSPPIAGVSTPITPPDRTISSGNVAKVEGLKRYVTHEKVTTCPF